MRCPSRAVRALTGLGLGPQVMQDTGADFTSTFRRLADVPLPPAEAAASRPAPAPAAHGGAAAPLANGAASNGDSSNGRSSNGGAGVEEAGPAGAGAAPLCEPAVRERFTGRQHRAWLGGAPMHALVACLGPVTLAAMQGSCMWWVRAWEGLAGAPAPCLAARASLQPPCRVACRKRQRLRRCCMRLPQLHTAVVYRWVYRDTAPR